MRNDNKFIGRLSLAYFFVVVFLTFLIHFLPLLILSFLAFFFPIAMRAYYFIFYSGAKIYLFFSGVKFKEKNLAFLKKAGSEKYLIVSNHRSHLDMFLLLAHVYRLRAVANAKLFKIPVLGQFMKLSKHFPLERGQIETYKKTIEKICQAFKLGDVVLFFPEMTRCLAGFEGIQKFRLTPFQLARENNMKIIPMVIHGTDSVWPKGESVTHFNHRVSLRALEPVDPTQFGSSVDLCLHIHEVMEKNLMEMNS